MSPSAQAEQWGVVGLAWVQAAPLLPTVQCHAASRPGRGNALLQTCSSALLLLDWEQAPCSQV